VGYKNKPQSGNFWMPPIMAQLRKFRSQWGQASQPPFSSLEPFSPNHRRVWFIFQVGGNGFLLFGGAKMGENGQKWVGIRLASSNLGSKSGFLNIWQFLGHF
jgi:hypothetical protein